MCRASQARREGCDLFLSHAGNPVFEDAAFRALEGLWAMRSPLNLLGSSLDMERSEWKDASGGVGASSDSFYEYLLKSYILLGHSSPLLPSLPVLPLHHP